MAQYSNTTSPSAASLRDAAVSAATFAAPVGRLLLSLIFVMSGVMKFVNWNATAESMADKGMPMVPVLLGAAALVELTGGLMLLFGWQARLGALALFLFLIPTTLLFHNFWDYEGMQQTNQMQHFMKNLTIMGGLLMVVGFGAGRLSCDAYGCGPGEARR